MPRRHARLLPAWALAPLENLEHTASLVSFASLSRLASMVTLATLATLPGVAAAAAPPAGPALASPAPLRLERPVVLLGEVHDHPQQHALRAEAFAALLATGARPALVMEQFDRERQAELDALRAAQPGVDADTLIALSKRLHDLGVVPYYLHLLDRVNGTAHFEVSEERGQELVTAMAQSLPGFLVPKLAREIPGREAKTVISAGL